MIIVSRWPASAQHVATGCPRGEAALPPGDLDPTSSGGPEASEEARYG
jgi:hypothetical protein